jgi:hypothetical protein
MALRDSLRIRVFADFRALFDTAALCSLAAAVWPPLVFAKITGMWAAMVLAMIVVPCARRLSPAGRLGLCAGALSFCGLAGLVQPAARIGFLLVAFAAAYAKARWFPACPGRSPSGACGSFCRAFRPCCSMPRCGWRCLRLG